MLCAKKIEKHQLHCMQPIFFQKFHFTFIFHFSSGTDFQLIYRGDPVNWSLTMMICKSFKIGPMFPVPAYL